MLNEDTPIDKNKSSLTHKITSGAQVYLKDRGFKPIETEVRLADRWIADLASVCVPTATELQYMKLVPKKPHFVTDWKYFRDKYGEKYYEEAEFKVLQDAHTQKHNDWKKNLDSLPSPLTALVEVKTSRGDFQQDDKWTRVSPVNMRYLSIPAGLLKRPEYPLNWFVLEHNVDGKVTRLAQQGSVETISFEQRMWVIHEIALRRHHRTENVWMRDVMKRFNAEQSKEKTSTRVSNVVSAVKAIISGGNDYCKTIEDCCRFNRIKYDTLPWHTKEDLKSLWRSGLKNSESKAILSPDNSAAVINKVLNEEYP